MAIASSPIPVGPEVLHANALGTVTAHYVTIRDYHQRSHTIVALGCISEITTLKIVRMPLMACSIGSFIIAAAAQCSRQGGGAATPFGLVGILFLLAYLTSRRASLSLAVDAEGLRTAYGTYGEAGELTTAIRSASE